MKPPENEEAAPGQESGSLRSEDSEKVTAIRAEIKRTILVALAGKVVCGSDFEARRIRARDSARRKNSVESSGSSGSTGHSATANNGGSTHDHR